MHWGMRRAIFTGAVISVSLGGKVIFEECCGTIGGPGTEAVTPDTLFDLASLTKILATTAAWITLCSGKQDILDLGLGRWFGDLPQEKEAITPRHLLAHSSGLPAWRPYYLLNLAPWPCEAVRVKILGEPLSYSPGKGCLYSDLGFMLLAWMLEHETGKRFEEYCKGYLYEPLGIEELLVFRPSAFERSIAWTRQGDTPGLVNDLNARALGGVSGHAGLFGTARGVTGMAGEILYALKIGSDLLRKDSLEHFVVKAGYLPNSTRALGFDTPSGQASSSGSHFSSQSVGHTGFTGTSLWIDPDKDLSVVLLTNRVFMGEADQRIRSFRPHVHDTVCEELRAGGCCDTNIVRSGTRARERQKIV